MTPINAGQSLYISYINGPNPHLWFVMTDPDGTPSKVAAVMVRTATEYTDPTLVLEPVEHSFIDRDTCVDFASTELYDVSLLERGIETGVIQVLDDASDELLAKIRVSLFESENVKQYILDYCSDKF